MGAEKMNELKETEDSSTDKKGKAQGLWRPIALIAVVAVGAVALFGNALTDEFDSIQAEVNLANNL